VLILAIGFLFQRLDMFVDITLAYAVLNFIGTIAIAKFLGTEREKA
jgi:multicomponent Na+:H+ antiporter subunit F